MHVSEGRLLSAKNFSVLKGPALSAFFCEITSLKRLKFHMHVSDDDSNMFCKFDEIW